MLILFIVFCSIFTFASCDVSHLKQEDINKEEKNPYAFGYAAGRYQGHIDRTHSEISDGNVVQGSYSYVDPNHRIRTVNYVADGRGFRPEGDVAPSDTAAVAAAKHRHSEDFRRIADAHRARAVAGPAQTAAYRGEAARHDDLYRRIAEEHARLAAAEEPIVNDYKLG